MSAASTQPSGYASPDYARALEHLGTPLALPGSGGTLLVRPIASAQDAVGPYPLFACADWNALSSDLDALAGRLVSVTLVADPWGDWEPELLRAAFPDLARPYKDHFVVDLALPAERRTSSHHRRNARRASEQVEVERVAHPPDAADEWIELYAQLIVRHRIRGPAAFPPESLRRQLRVPGARLWRARRDGRTLGVVIWYVRGEVASYHLAAYADEGYQARASFALFSAALDELAREGVAWAHLGAAAGVDARSDDGLTRFKQGWSTGTRSAWLCGRVLDQAAYAQLAPLASQRDFFPAYRAGETA